MMWQPLVRRISVGLLTAAGLLGVGFFGGQLEQPVALTIPEQKVAVVAAPADTPPPKSPTGGLPSSAPLRLRIHSIQLDTELVGVGLESDGAMEIPSGDKAGWYTGALTPGEIGPAILVGHVHGPRSPAIFWRLREVKPGATMEIDRADGKTLSFRVDQLRQIPQAELTGSEVFAQTDAATIRLITCGGSFDRKTQSYSHNIVVFATLVAPNPDLPAAPLMEVVRHALTAPSPAYERLQ